VILQNPQKHSAQNISFVHIRLANTAAEGLNRMIRIDKDRASGWIFLRKYRPNFMRHEKTQKNTRDV